MTKPIEKITRAAHIKKNTVGTSNELSFSVLDAAKNELDDNEGRRAKRKLPRLGSVSLFTMPGRKKSSGTPVKDSTPLASSAPDAPAPLSMPASRRAESAKPALSCDEVKRRKSSRKRRKAFAITLLCMALMAALGIGGWWLYNEYGDQQAHRSQLTEALGMIEQTDDAILGMDDLLVDLDGAAVIKLNPATTKEDIAAVKQEIPAAEDSLATSKRAIEASVEGMKDSTDKDAASQALASISARQAMIDDGMPLLDEVLAASTAATSAREGWDLLLSADALIREAAELVTETTTENVQASMEKSNEALGQLASADEKFASASDAFARADFSAYRSYLAKRIEAQNYALASDQAFLDRNKEETSAQNDAYNKAESDAAALAASLPDSPDATIADAFNAATEQDRETYGNVRSQVSSADAFLRDYLGAPGK